MTILGVYLCTCPVHVADYIANGIVLLGLLVGIPLLILLGGQPA